MKIASTIKPRSGRPRHVAIHGHAYVFAPVKDKHGVTHFVADVNDADHASLLLENDAFYTFDKNGLPAPKLSRNAKQAAKAPTSSKETWSTEILAEAAALLTQPVSDMGAAIGRVSSLGVVDAAAALENEGQKREDVLELLARAIEGAKQSGVK